MRGTDPEELPRDAWTLPSWNPANEREVVDAKTNVMQANLPKKFHRAAGQALTVEKQVFIKLSNSFAELDHCTDRSVHYYEGMFIRSSSSITPYH
jgi:hypothetical protein